MSIIGDYIHLNVENYLAYGVSKRGEKVKPSLADVYRAQKQKNYERINSIPSVKSSVLNTLSERVQKNFPEGRDAAKETLNKAISEQKLSDAFKDFILNNVDGDLTRRSKIFKSTISNMTTKNEMVCIEEAKRLRNNLYKNIDTLNRRFNEGRPAGTTPETIAKNFTEYFNMLGMALPDGGYVVNPQDIKNTDTLTAMKLILQDISFSQADKATLHGQMGEQTVRMCGDVAVRKGLESINGVIVGSGVSSFKIDESIIPKSVGQVFQQDTGINLYRAYSSQDKVDVEIVVNKQPLNVSVKAYTPQGNKLRAHLQDVSLLTSLVTTQSEFANHWLNIHTLKLSSALLDSALKEHMRYEALVSGNMLKKGASLADTFVAIDVANGRVYSASTKDILNNKTSSQFLLKPNISNLYIGGNQKASSWSQRIANILKNVHQTKISAILNVSLKPV